MLDFITNNAVWFISGGILIVLVTIGYYADKKGLGSKKVEKPVVEPEEVEEIKEEKPKTKKPKKEVLDIDMDIPFVANVDDIKEEKKEENEDLNVPFGDSSLDEFASKSNNEEASTLDEYATNTKEEDLNAPFGDQEKEEVVENQPEEEKIETVETQPEEIKEEAIEEVKTETIEEDKEETKEEDIWNF